MKQIVLIGLNGREVARLPFPPKTDAWIFHDGKWYGFGVGKIDGEHHCYQADPEPQPMGPLTSEHPSLAPAEPEPNGYVDRNQAIAEIRRALKARSGKQWSVTGGRGTAWGWITIDAPPAQRVDGYITDAERKELAALLGLESVHCQGISIAASSDYYREYIDRANGRQPTAIAKPYWD